MNRRIAGSAFGLAAAALFGASVPCSKLLLPGVGAGVMAGLLYLSAGAAVSLWRLGASRSRPHEAPLARPDLPLLAGVVACGGVAGPVLLLLGLRHLTGASASLLLALEAPFTILIAVVFFRDHLGRRGVLGAGLVLAAGASLALHDSPSRGDVLGAAALVGAALAWAAENNLSQRLALKDPLQIVQVKGLAGGLATLAAALAFGERLPSASTMLKASVIGALGYGLSVVWNLRAVRDLGAARQAGLFAAAPLFGAALSTALLGDAFPLLAAPLVLGGLLLLVLDQHRHAHRHELLEHEHLHTHDAHHQHPHGPAQGEDGSHSHRHVHLPLEHEHEHAPDAHHRHEH